MTIRKVCSVLAALVAVPSLAVSLSASAAQPGISLFGNIVAPGQAITLGYSMPAGWATFELDRVPDPRSMLLSANPHRPSFEARQVVARVRNLRRHQNESGYGEINLGALPSGVYRVTAREGSLSARIAVIVTRLGLVVKRSEKSVLVYAADRLSGQPQAANVWVNAQSVGATNADGLLKGIASAPGADPIFVAARSGNDWALADASWNSWAASKLTGYVYTDRPVYRPGDAVQARGVLRDSRTLLAPAPATVTARLLDPQDKEVGRLSARSDVYGAFEAGFNLPAVTPSGPYRIEATTGPLKAGSWQGRETYSASLYVQPYVKPEYRVDLTASAPRAVQGDTVTVTARATYLAGGVVGGGHGTLYVTRSAYYPPWPGQGDETLATTLPPNVNADYGSDLIAQKAISLDANGEAHIALRLDRTPDGQPARYRVGLDVNDETGSVVTGALDVIAYPAAVTVNVATDGYAYHPGGTARVSIATADLSGKPRATGVTAKLIKETWTKTKGGEWRQKLRQVSSRTLTTGGGGQAVTLLAVKESGAYRVRVVARDAQGRPATAETFLWVTQPGEEISWNYRDLNLSFDRAKYAPGDTATLLIGSPRPGTPVLVTLEGDTVNQAVVLRERGSVITYRFKVTAAMTHGVYAGAAMLGGNAMYSQNQLVPVPADDQKLTVSVKTPHQPYKPGDNATFDVQVRGADGRGAPAQVGLSVVDEAVYLVRADETPSIFAAFHSPLDNTVGTSDGLNYWFESVGAQGAPRGPLTRAAFADAKAAAGAPEQPRQDFRDTIAWAPRLITGPDGRVSVTVRLPDNLTTYRATARAITLAGRAGEARGSTLVTKDLIARLPLPTYLVRGDTATIPVSVSNTTATALTTTVTAEASGLQALDTTSATLQLAAGGRGAVSFTWRATDAGLGSMTASAKSGALADALRRPVRVLPRGFADEATANLSLPAAAQVFTLPSDMATGSLTLNISVTPNLAAAIEPAIEYLVGFPYGCTEQTMSRFLPAILTRAALGAGALPSSLTKAELDAVTTAGLDRLRSFQHADGGWGFWIYDESTLDMSAYVLNGLTRAKGLGFAVNAAVLDRAVTYVANHAASASERIDDRGDAYRALATAGRLNLNAARALASRAGLSSYSLANLAVAFATVGAQSDAQAALTRLTDARREDKSGVHWAGTGSSLEYWSDNDIQVTARALEALARVEPGSALIPGAQAWLLAARRGPRWISTQDTASVVEAALALPRPALLAAFPVTVLVGGQEVKTISVPVGGVNLSLPVTTNGRAPITVELHAPAAPVGASASLRLNFTREPVTLNGDSSGDLNVTRAYERLKPVWDEKNQRYTMTREPLAKRGVLQPVSAGDVILVTLRVSTQGNAVRYLAVSDPIPAGFSVLDERAFAVAGLPDASLDSWRYWYAGRDQQETTLDFFADWIHGVQVMQYALRATTVGTFTALPTTAFAMYDPSRFARSAAATLRVQPAKR